MADSKRVHTLVVDSGPIIKNEPSPSSLLAQAESLFTIPAVVSEIRDESTRTRFETLLKPFVTLRQPSPASIKFVTDFARKTRDLDVLSKPDILIIALAYELECERSGGDWRLRKVPGQKDLNGPTPRPLSGPGQVTESTSGAGTLDSDTIEDHGVSDIVQSSSDVANELTDAKEVANVSMAGDDFVSDFAEPPSKDATQAAPRQRKHRRQRKKAQATDSTTDSVQRAEPGWTMIPSRKAARPQMTVDKGAAKKLSSQSLAVTEATEATDIAADECQSLAQPVDRPTSSHKSPPHDYGGSVGGVPTGNAHAGDANADDAHVDDTHTAGVLKVDSPQESAPIDDSSESDGGGWITPGNLTAKQAEDSGGAVLEASADHYMEVAVITTDFAMQNVILQMNLNLLSSSLQRVRHVRSTVLRCQACFLVTKQMDKQFCTRCGKPTLTRVSCSTTANGEFKIHLKKNFQYNNRGDRYSIPKPVHGSANGRIKGGGKGGWGSELILAEDQKEYERASQTEKRVKERNLMDEDYLPSILTGDRGKSGGRIKVGAGRNVNAKKRS